MLQLVGVVTTTSFVHQSDPEKQGNKSPTLKTGFWDASHEKRRLVPFVTGNSLRGTLRRAATERVLDALDKPVSRALFSVLTCGKATRGDIALVKTTKSMVEGSANLFAGLFGGGGFMLPSRYTMAPLFPMVEWCQRALHPALRDRMITADRLSYTTDDGKLKDISLLTDIVLTSRDDVMAGKGQDRIADYQKSLDAWLREVSAGRVAKATDKKARQKAKAAGEKYEGEDGAKTKDLNGFNFIEAILPGTPLQFLLGFKPKTTDAQVGLMLLSVCDWANANVIGGASARGFGRFDAEIALYDSERQVLPNIFAPGGHATTYTLNHELDHYVQAAEEALHAMSIEDLEEAYGTKNIGV